MVVLCCVIPPSNDSYLVRKLIFSPAFTFNFYQEMISLYIFLIFKASKDVSQHYVSQFWNSKWLHNYLLKQAYTEFTSNAMASSLGVLFKFEPYICFCK